MTLREAMIAIGNDLVALFRKYEDTIPRELFLQAMILSLSRQLGAFIPAAILNGDGAGAWRAIGREIVRGISNAQMDHEKNQCTDPKCPLEEEIVAFLSGTGLLSVIEPDELAPTMPKDFS